MNEKNKFACEICKFSTTSNYNLQKHFTSKKHSQNINSSLTLITAFQCKKCNKYYKGQSGLWSHSNKCQVIKESVPNPVIVCQESTIDVVLLEIKKMGVRLDNMDKINEESRNNQQITSIVTNNNTVNNNTFNMTVFLNEKCGEAINLEEFVKRIMFEFADSKLMMESYVEGTCNIIQKNLEQLPVNKRPMHCLTGEDPHQQLMHIRQDDKWNTSSELNWMQQIHADDDDAVVVKNPIYYALQKIDDKKLEYLAYNLYANDMYVKNHSRLRDEVKCRPDLKEKVYHKILKMITLDTDKLDSIEENRKIKT
jgi:hypothetical protein